MTLSPARRSSAFHSAVRQMLEALEPRQLMSVSLQSAVATPLSDVPAGNPVAPVLADLNADGLLDVVVGFESSGTGVSGMVQIGLNDGVGTFSLGVPVDAGLFVGQPVVGDFDGDTKPDIAVANAFEGQVRVLKGNGNGTFAAPVAFTAGISPESLAVGDFNADSKADLVVGNRSGGNVMVYLGDAAATLGAPTTIAVTGSPVSVHVGDFDGDSRLDLLVGASGPAETDPAAVYVFAGLGDGTFNATPIATAGIPGVSSVADLDGNGDIDLVAGITAKDVADVARNQGNGTFVHVGKAVSGPESPGLAADLNEDGKPDLLTAVNGTITVLPGVGDGTFGKRLVFDAAGGSQPAIADVNGDGRGDVLTVAGTVGVVTGRTLNVSIGRRVGPDLSIKWKTNLPVAALNAAKFKISVTVTNTGNEKIKAEVPIQIFLSPDSTIDTAGTEPNDSIVIQSFPKLSLSPGKSKTISLKPELIVGVGTYYAIAAVDLSGSTGDLNLFDNTDIATNQTIVDDPFFDFVGQIPTIKPSTATAGKTVKVDLLVTNLGNVLASGKITLRLAASLDTGLSDDDILVAATLNSVKLNPGATKKYSLKFKVAGNLSIGNYFLLGLINQDGAFFETDIDNNTAISDQQLTVT